MADSTHSYAMSSEAKDNVKEPFRKRGIKLHIDTAGMGGGTVVTHDKTFNRTEAQTIYNYNFNTNRHGSFAYCIMCHDLDPNEYGWAFRNDAFALAGQTITDNEIVSLFKRFAILDTFGINNDLDGDGLTNSHDKDALEFTRKFALVIGVTDFDWWLEWMTPDLPGDFPGRVRDTFFELGFQVTLASGHVTFSDFCNAIGSFLSNNNIKSSDLVVLYILSHGTNINGYKIAFSDDIYGGDDFLLLDGIRPEIARIGQSLDFLWLHTCYSWTFVTDGDANELKNNVGDFVFFGADGVGWTTGNTVFQNAILNGESVEEAIDDIQNEQFENDQGQIGNWNNVFHLYDVYPDDLFIT